MDAWTPKAKDTKGYVRECYEAAANWHSLSSFFESQGYYLYDYPSVREGADPSEEPFTFCDYRHESGPISPTRAASPVKKISLPFVFVR
ncbi:hypothetical protein NMY22_g14656 [Coprinellus aureogranulatus]|nr:hypothetical protein NMY22_g14656 [Coprinellus aureogranulatus]